MPQLEVIYTFEDGQQIKTLPFHEILLTDRNTFFEYVTSNLNGKEKETLCKISCCIYYAIGMKIPDWYNSTNGKFWDNEIIKLMDEIWAIKSLIEPVNA